MRKEQLYVYESPQIEVMTICIEQSICDYSSGEEPEGNSIDDIPEHVW